MSRAGERQKKGLLFDKVSARPATTIGFGRTRPLKLLTPTHWPPSLVVKRAFALLSPMVKGENDALPIVKLFTVRPATEKFAGTPFTAVRSTWVPSSRRMVKSGGAVAHSNTRSPPPWQHSFGRLQPPHVFGSGHICWAHAAPASRIVVTHTRNLIRICSPPSFANPVDARRMSSSCTKPPELGGCAAGVHLMLLAPTCHRCASRRTASANDHAPTHAAPGDGARTRRSASPAPSPPGGARGTSPL